MPWRSCCGSSTSPPLRRLGVGGCVYNRNQQINPICSKSARGSGGAGTQNQRDEPKRHVIQKEGTVLGLHEDSTFKAELKKVRLKTVDLIGLGSGSELDQKLKYVNDLSSGVIFGKELVNAPTNVLTPAVLAEKASKIASEYSDVFTTTILDVEKCRELKMGSYLGVSVASANSPHFIHLCYKPVGGNVKRKMVVVGKVEATTLRLDQATILVKFDMGGSAAVFGAEKALAQIKPPGVEVHFIVAACENMIRGTGMRPGDILTASNGKTIEVNNTDAEGRLTLADALVYACNQGVDKLTEADFGVVWSCCLLLAFPVQRERRRRGSVFAQVQYSSW
uniref:Leucine aminopeptidase 2, chloroplastic n=1 Tax=Aegilops tauschii TaxID=37682 RepID=M8C567_AEGTA